ncbi:MAG: UPF0149 family protein [Gammaproteobacteria bacterium]
MNAALYDRVTQVLDTLGCDLGAGECHGALCGLLCAPRAFSPRTWLEHVAGEDSPAAFEQGAARDVLDELLRESVTALGSADLDFALLLPGDDAGLAARSAAFAGWCRGFLAGLGLGGIGDMRELGADARGFVNDLERFGRLEAVDGDEADERAFAELTEYTRMGVLVVHGEVHAAAAPGAPEDPTPTLH